MDASRFDALAKALSAVDSRRRLLAFFAAVPIVGSRVSSPDDGEAKPRKHRADRRHDAHPDLAADKKKRKKKRKKPQPPACTPESVALTCAGKCGSVTNTCNQVVDCGPCTCTPPCGTCERCNGTTCEACEACCDDVCCSQAGSTCHATTGACCVPESRAQTCDGQCGDVTNTCGVVVDCGPCTCNPTCPACQICDEDTGQCVADPGQQGQSCGSEGQVCQPDGTCACVPACGGKTCGPDGCGGSCGPCDGGEVCTTAGACCTPTTCVAIEQAMCQNPDDCGDYGICGTFPDGCGGTLDCGGCSHPCIACQDNICVYTGGEVCGPDTCCTNQCCFNANQGVCGTNMRCTGGNCCPLGWSCCNGMVNGSPRSSCYNINTYCQGQGLVCCGAGNTCCTDEPCCTSDAQCTGGRRCIANGAPSTAGCCSFNF